LVVGINSDSSARSIKGDGRPFMDQNSRKSILLSLSSVDEVRIFDELTPERLIKEIMPNVLVKGGDWKNDEIVGADFILANGGEVHSLPLLEGFSSSDLVNRIRDESRSSSPVSQPHTDLAVASLNQHAEVISSVVESSLDAIRGCAELLSATLSSDRKILICGNGGSAADAQHIAAELVGRYESERRALPAIALTTDTSALTALANDYDFERIFARQVEALATAGDCLIAISTSGNSPNIIAAVMAARQGGCKVIGMTGAKGKKLAGLCDACIVVPSDRTARIQEAHITIAHIWCELIERAIVNK
jgi:D-sedoheptulose 7-phosphate isomerase